MMSQSAFSKCLLYVLKYKKFSESRCRSFTVSLTVGLEALVGIAKKNGAQWYIDGFSKFSAELRRFASVCGMAGFLPDSVLLILMKDDRVVRQQEQIHLAIQKNLKSLDELPCLISSGRVWPLCVSVSCAPGAYALIQFMLVWCLLLICEGSS